MSLPIYKDILATIVVTVVLRRLCIFVHILCERFFSKKDYEISRLSKLYAKHKENHEKKDG